MTIVKTRQNSSKLVKTIVILLKNGAILASISRASRSTAVADP